MTALNTIGLRLAANIDNAKKWELANNRELAHAQKINIVGAGGSLTAAYEQLRNAAENTEEHLLLQNAIKRFYKQLFITRDEGLIRSSGNELAIELTLAGYLPNDSLVSQQVEEISRLATRHYRAYEQLHRERKLSVDMVTRWTLDTLAVEVESILNDHRKDHAFVDFAYAYFSDVIPEESVAKKAQSEDYAAALFAAIHMALLKSDSAVIRTGLLQRYQVNIDDLATYVEFNKRIDSLLTADVTDTLNHIVDRQGAPMRIIRRMIEDRSDFAEILPKRETFLDAYEKQVNREYGRISKRINRAIIRSVIFLIITKFLIGVAIEIPYDFWAYGEILWQPLLINLFFPPVYMVALRLTHTLPGYANTAALIDRVDAMLYGEKTTLMKKQLTGRRYSPIFSIIYALLGLIVFGAATWALLMLQFSLVHIAIFFVFISAASFLGFRLSRLIRELEVMRSSSNGITFVRDIVYLPFVVVGQWMSDKYSRVNIVTIVLDMLIELPLKTILRLVRQWGAFIDDRKDRI